MNDTSSAVCDSIRGVDARAGLKITLDWGRKSCVPRGSISSSKLAGNLARDRRWGGESLRVERRRECGLKDGEDGESVGDISWRSTISRAGISIRV